MEYLTSIKSINNTNNITIIQLVTNNRNILIRLPYIKYSHPKGNSYKYSLNIFQYCKLHNIDTKKYLYDINFY